MTGYSKKPKRDIYGEITDNIIKSIERDPASPKMPWHRSGGVLSLPSNATTGNAYNGVNVLNLWVTAEVKHYQTPLWASYKQWKSINAQVKKGEKSALIVFYKELQVEPTDDEDNGKRRMARASYVFNADQVEGFDLPIDDTPDLGPIERLELADKFIKATGADIRTGGDRAYYASDSDHIQMPDEHLFTGTDTMNRTESWYAVECHELAHWTAHSSRLDRQLGKRFGKQAYAAEELIAEISASYMCAELHITPELRPDHAQYINNWLQLLKTDDRAIFTAAAAASKAVAYLQSLQAKTKPQS